METINICTFALQIQLRQIRIFASTLEQSVALATLKPHNTSQKIFSYTVKIWLSFIDTATYTSRKITIYFVKQSFICMHDT